MHRLFLFAGLALGCGCASIADPALDQPAIAPEYSEKAISEWQSIISSALSGKSVTLLPETFSKKSSVIIEPRIINDRSFQRPNHFHLVINNGRCAIIHEQTGERYALKQTRCLPV